MRPRRRPSNSRGIACVASLLLATLAQATEELPLPLESRVPGGIALLDLGPPESSEARVMFKGYRAPLLLRHGRRVAVIGIPLDATPGPQTVEINHPNGGPTTTVVFEVASKAYDEQRLTVKNQRHVDPSPQDLERIAADRVRIDRALSTYSADREPSLRLAAPDAGTR